MEKLNFAFIVLLIQCSSDTVFSSEENELEEPPLYVTVFERVNDVCTTINECKFECCQLNKIYSIATSRCLVQHIDQQLSDVKWKSPFSAYHKRSCQSKCSENVTTQERKNEDENFRLFMDKVISTPNYLCNRFIEVCYSYAYAKQHWAKFNAMDFFRTAILPIVTEALSIVFLSITLILYLAVPGLCHRIHDKCFLFHLGFRIVYFSTRLILSFSNNSGFSCTFYAFVLQFSGLAAAFWLNVICFHLWRCITSVIPTFQSSTRTLCYYSLYAFGCSFSVTVITCLADFWLPVELKSFKPRIGDQFCGIIGYDKHLGAPLWLQPQFIYYFSFHSVIQIINFCAFLHIVFKILSKERQFGRTEKEAFRRHQIHHLGFLTYVKLFLLMGLTTILEIIFFHLGGSAVERLSLRLVSAFLLFVIFVCNERVFGLTKKRFSQLTSSKSTTQNTVPELAVIMR